MTGLHHQTALVTGGSSGIGREVALALAARGAAVTLVGRSQEKGEAVVRAAKERGAARSVTFIAADLADMRVVRRVAARVLEAQGRLDYLVHSAGVHHRQRSLPPDGVETNFAVNYLSRFLLPTCSSNASGREVGASSRWAAPTSSTQRSSCAFAASRANVFRPRPGRS